MDKMLDTFTAYKNGKLPNQNGYILSVFYHDSAAYTRYELVSFGNVKDIFASEDGLVFQAEGRKLYVLVEPAGWPTSHIEPAYRTDAERVPYRFKEMIDFTTGRRDHVYIGAEPVVSYTSFTVVKPTGQNVSYIFYPSDDVKKVILEFFRLSLWKQTRVPQSDARRVLEPIGKVFDKMIVDEGGFH
ncbi:transposase [Spirochaeta dissipatitropha]